MCVCVCVYGPRVEEYVWLCVCVCLFGGEKCVTECVYANSVVLLFFALFAKLLNMFWLIMRVLHLLLSRNFMCYCVHTISVSVTEIGGLFSVSLRSYEPTENICCCSGGFVVCVCVCVCVCVSPKARRNCRPLLFIIVVIIIINYSDGFGRLR